jgi:putative methionine-R-sulfoxide reductase with GAF domain
MPAAKLDVAEEKDKPVFDEQTLARLLEAAYVLQEHNRELRQREVNLEVQRDQLGAEERAASARLAASQSPVIPASEDAGAKPAANEDYTQTLAQIVETQRQIQARNLQLQAAMDLVAERVTEIAHAGGAAIGMVGGKNVVYRAVAGGMSPAGNTEVAMEKALCVASLRTGQVIRCTDVNAEFLLDVEECQRRGIQSMIGVPVYHDGGIAGGLELYYASAQAFTEQDVHTCQLMAGLVTEALVREDEAASQKAALNRRAAMREALEKIKPTVAAIADRVANKTVAAATSAKNSICRKCGHQLVGEEQFCGNCGTPRSGDYGTPSLQSKVASLWEMQQAMQKTSAASPENAAVAHVPNENAAEAAPNSAPITAPTTEPAVVPSPIDDATEGPGSEELESEEPESEKRGPLRIPLATPDQLATLTLATPPEADSAPADFPPNHVVDHERAPQDETALASAEQPWSSAAAARDYLEQLAGNKRATGVVQFLSARRGDIYLAIAVIVVAIVTYWGIWSNHPVRATGNSAAAAAEHKPDPAADLSWFDHMLISLGLAEAPAPPESKGNPDTQVWVDLHTALYYCPGADLYGKTPKGKFTSQRDAQLDSFGPASGRPCD